MSHRDWKQALQHRIPEQWGHEIDIFEAQFELRRQGKIDEKVFAETRLRRGTYGQRYDNGQRHDGTAARELKYPCGELTKGPDTVWDAPGMQWIKIPYGGGLGERLRPALRHLLEAAQRIQAGPEELPEAPRFRTDRLRVYFPDRLNAPNTEESFEAVGPELACALAGLFGAEPELSRAYEGPRWLLAVDAAAPGTDDLPTLLSRVADESVPSG
jgi:hypothetical protein